MDVFCVLSAIGNDYGIFSYKERFQQLLQTIDSIRQYGGNSHICLYDTSHDPIPNTDALIIQQSVDRVTWLHDHPHIIELKKYLSNDTNMTYHKTIGEIVSMMCFLHTDYYFSGFNRIFKISGRYQLTPEFDLSLHHSMSGKIVIKPKTDWYGSLVHQSRLWSFDAEMLPKIKNMFIQIYNTSVESVNRTGSTPIIEHSIYNEIEKMKLPVHEAPTLGITGYFGQDGAIVTD